MKAPLVSTVIVSYNSREDLASCLPTLLSQTVRQEIIVVDNCSTDGTAEWITANYPDVQFIQAHKNYGYAGANNIGASKARGEYLFILNPDTELHPNSLDTMLQVIEDNPRCIVTPKLLQKNGTINACGNKMHMTGITTCNGVGQPAEEYSGIFPVFLLSGAAFLIHREVWNDVGGFCEEYFMYMEDVDFSLRARLFGYDIVCCAEASVLHKWKLGLGAQKFYYLERNRLFTLLKLYEKKTFLKLSFSLLFTEFATWVYASVKGPPFLKARMKAYGSMWSMRKTLKQSRADIQERRIISDTDLLAHMSPSLPFDMVVSPRLAKVLTKTTTPLYEAFKVGGNGT